MTDNTEPTSIDTVSDWAGDAKNELQDALSLEYGAQTADLFFPDSIRDESSPKNKELISFTIVSRDHAEKKTIWLQCPPGISIPDGVEFNQVQLGTLVGKALEAGESVVDNIKATFSRNKTSNWSNVGSVADLVAASTITAIKKSNTALGEKGMLTAGLTANPYTNNAFVGSNIRTFEFTFKMVAESKDESESIKKIENTFRKFLYPRKHPQSDMVLVYPPYWMIRFYSGVVEEGETVDYQTNKYMPRIKLCNLQSMNTTFNSAASSFHNEGQPVEVDLTLSFTESMAMTREDLYGRDGDAPVYDNLEYRDDVEKSNVFKAFGSSNKEEGGS